MVFKKSCDFPLQVEREKVSLMVNLQESQTQLQHTQAALTEQHEKTLNLSQKVVALRRFQRSVQLHQKEGKDSTSAAFAHDSLLQMEMDVAETPNEEKHKEESQIETLSKSKLFSYQTPGLEILQCKYRVAVTEVVELKAELKVLHDRLAQCVESGREGGGGGTEGEGDAKARGEDHLQQLEKQVVSMEKSTREEREKVATQYNVFIISSIFNGFCIFPFFLSFLYTDFRFLLSFDMF